MLEAHVTPGSNVVEIDCSGSIDADQMVRCRETLERAVAEHGKLRLLARYGEVDLRHSEARAFWEDLKNVPLIRHVERCAIVAEERWMRTISDVAGPILPCELRTFTPAQEAEAQAWVSDADSPSA